MFYTAQTAFHVFVVSTVPSTSTDEPAECELRLKSPPPAATKVLINDLIIITFVILFPKCFHTRTLLNQTICLRAKLNVPE